MRALRHQQLPDLGRAGEAELAHGRVSRQLAADQRCVLCGAGHDLEDAFRESRLEAEARDRECGQRRLLGRLEHHRAAGRERRRSLARGHRSGKVPRGDAGGDADGALRDDDPPVGGEGRDRVAVDALRLLAEPFEERRGVTDLDPRLGERLALLQRHQSRELVLVLVHQVGPAAQDARAVLRDARPPGGQRVLGARDRAARLRGAHARNLGEGLAGRRIDDRERLTGVRLDVEQW